MQFGDTDGAWWNGQSLLLPFLENMFAGVEFWAGISHSLHILNSPDKSSRAGDPSSNKSELRPETEAEHLSSILLQASDPPSQNERERGREREGGGREGEGREGRRTERGGA